MVRISSTMGGVGGSEIESYDPVSKKPKTLSHQGRDLSDDQDLSDDSGSMSEDESDNDCSDELDFSTHIPIFYQLLKKWTDRQFQDDPELGQIRMNIEELRSKGFKGISFTAKRVSDAYRCLHIFSDPVDSNPMEHLISSKQRGFEIKYVENEGCCALVECRDPTVGVAYVQLLKKLKDSEVDLGIIASEDYLQYREFLLGSGLPSSIRNECLWDYFEIHVCVEKVKQWQGLRKLLLDPNSAEEYRKDPKSFEEALKRNHRFIKDFGGVTVFEAVVKWWTGDPEMDGESARVLIENGCKKALEDHDDRLKGYCTKADYLKLKLDVARIAGIIKVPDEIAKFVLPGHYSWNESKGTFDPLPYK